MSANDTLLRFSGFGIPPWSARGLTQTLSPIEQAGQYERTVNGVLTNIALPLFEKYQSTIQCSDQRVPALNGVFPGRILTVDCVVELSYLTAGGSPDRTVVAGSARVEGDYTFYRPQLIMLLRTFEKEVDEWGAVVSWAMELEEV